MKSAVRLAPTRHIKVLCPLEEIHSVDFQLLRGECEEGNHHFYALWNGPKMELTKTL